jgi:hypothetical protein
MGCLPTCSAPANVKAIKNAAVIINKLRLADTTVGGYTRLHRAAHTALHDMVFYRPDQFSRSSYDDDNNSLISE